MTEPASWVVAFAAADETQRSLLGGKGAGLAGMTRAGLPVPPGFTITTEACRAYYEAGRTMPAGLVEQVDAALAHLEEQTGKQFGGDRDPLLLSVRSGAVFSMPGMMDTVLNLGLNPTSTVGLAEATGDEGFAWDAYRRFVQMYGEIVVGVDPSRLHDSHDADRSDGERNVARLHNIVRDQSGTRVPDQPREQLRRAVAAVFDSWMGRRAIDYRAMEGIPDDLFTAVNVQAMVFGNTGPSSGTGVVFTRNPTTGEPGLWGEYLQDAQGEDVVAGLRTPEPIDALAGHQPEAHARLVELTDRLETTYRDIQDVEFTIEKDHLWLLQTRAAKRTGRAAIRCAVDMADEGLIDRREAVERVSPDRLEELLYPVVQPDDETVALVSGLPASPGGASGMVAFTADESVRLTEAGHDVVLVRQETSPDDFHGMVAARAVVTSRGGVTSHAAVVARGMGKCCVVGCEDMDVDDTQQLFRTPDSVVSAGEIITVDGTTGTVYAGEVPTVEPELDEHFDELMGFADEVKRLDVRANADNQGEAAVARQLGAHGIGLCRTEHMFFEGDRIEGMRRMIMAPNAVARAEALAELEPLQTADFESLFTEMAGLPVTIRLLDPPLHEFLPSRSEAAEALTDLKLRLSGTSNLREIDRILHDINEHQDTLDQVEKLAEANPMLGHRGCRLGVSHPEITTMQARAIFTAAVRCAEAGIDAHPEVMVPLVAFAEEFRQQRDIIEATAAEVFAEAGREVPYRVGTMIELPRAALIADEICADAEFVSFGTNDLTQTALGLSRDDSPRFLPGYVKAGIIDADPFQQIDTAGVGALVETGTNQSRAGNPDVTVGVCGEHGGDPASIAFINGLAIDYVSCSPYRVPIARLAAAHAVIEGARATD
jgi:pyruvate,orthophosphate dikinase